LYQRIHTTKDFFVKKVFGTGDHLNFDNVQLKEVSRDLGQVYHPE
jgi:hypothetical protein